jgi:methanogenic corrinoid protein MtbC1
MQGRLCVASEHVASAIVRDSLSALLRRLPKPANAELVVVTTPESELHELGALLAAVTVAIRGYRVLYLGPHLPVSEIARAARESSASIVALSMVALEPELAIQSIRSLSSELPERVELVLGGKVSDRVREALGSRVLVPGSLAAFEHWLEARQRK